MIQRCDESKRKEEKIHGGAILSALRKELGSCGTHHFGVKEAEYRSPAGIVETVYAADREAVDSRSDVRRTGSYRRIHFPFSFQQLCRQCSG
jgi:hypothetical protein